MRTPEEETKLAIWRQKALDGTLTEAEEREAVALIRGTRHSAAYASETARRKKAKAEIPSADDLISEMMGGLE